MTRHPRIKVTGMKPGDPPISFTLPEPMKKSCRDCPFTDPTMALSLGKARMQPKIKATNSILMKF
jgi:hypothetical protein